ncbi:unnamed protein product [Rotaria socialis]|uniref:Sulfotransferase n=1 Tax=Rotaria socialis TaxID=392032 RepID=A0A820W9P2_9BILA|nr:unnamed protein product [Rotaria socialis]CAF4512725.1 unnamed protein product [Rotaria socialis]CAF4692031.1 unnamed protein product [Rotaria socialis]
MADNTLENHQFQIRKPDSDNAEQLRVIGAGLGRTGTSSLKIALEKLGFGPCHHMTELFSKPRQSIIFTQALDGRETDWHELMKGYGSAVDIPTAIFYKELHQAFPKAKFILTVRDSDEKWYESFKNTIGPVCTDIFYFIAVYPIRNLRLQCIFTRKLIKKWIHDYGEVGPKIHGLHNAQVIKEFKKELLIFNVKEGWEPLCQFLDVPIPKDIPFPNVNDAKHMTRRIFAIQAIGWTAWTLIIVVIAVGIKFISGFVDFT